MTKATVAQLETTVEELQATIATLQTQNAELQRKAEANDRVYLQGPVKFFKRAINRTTNQPMNFYEFVVSEQEVRNREDGSTYRVSLPFQQCRISGNRPDLVAAMQAACEENSFLVCRLRGAWKADGNPECDARGYLKARYAAFWVTSFEVIRSVPRDEQAPVRTVTVTAELPAPIEPPFSKELPAEITDEELELAF